MCNSYLHFIYMLMIQIEGRHLNFLLRVSKVLLYVL